jgi:4-diphosphocytidyl-2-C-methyl-D-erythritol kinase
MGDQGETIRISRMPIASSTSTVTCIAAAKVNLCLRVTGRRTDGYHLLDSIFAAIDFSDRLVISATAPRPRTAARVRVSCDYPGVPNDASNLAARAAYALLAECGVDADVDIVIDKRIPPGAGLGGGSSNAAAVLRGLSALLALPVTDRRLAELALALGADVPFFLTGGCARVRGIGEQIEPIRGWPGQRLIVALPPVAVSTAWAFRAYAAGFEPHPEEPARLADAVQLDATLMRNDLEAVVLAAHPEVARTKRGLLEAGALAAVMSGSGAAVVAVAPPAIDPLVVLAAFREALPDVPAQCVRILVRSDDRSVDPTPGYA